ncbi:MAG: SDR family oxidoreductase, partial [Dehalococcoidales bacterium]|nr:SDR family oxidoreductase [Dehalococcoidales bacterium]
FGKIDILVNNAAVIVRGLAENVLDEDWDRIMNTNLRGLFFCCQMVGKEMIKQQKGKIINVSSVISQLVQSGRSVYAISKAGVSHLTRALAMEWSKYNISVNAISPGLTITSINHEHFAEHPDELEAFVKVIPRGRVGSPSDYAGAAVFLASDASDYVCGQTLLIDGGMALP